MSSLGCRSSFEQIFSYFSHDPIPTYREGEKNPESQLGFLNDYLLFCQTLWGPKRQSIQVFLRKFLSTLSHPFSTFFYPFLIYGVLKKAKFAPLRSQMTITVNFLKTIIQDFLYRVYMADVDFRQKFLTKILNPQMGILTQSQIIFWENLNFQNCLHQQILTPGEKKNVFWRTQLPYLLPLTYHKFMTTFFFFLKKNNFFVMAQKKKSRHKFMIS